ncbi:MAG TPA: TonB family protein [Candidatus Krumholzibacteria bacterium]|nr:TonB family protein [Candidatus Krumholzibacteria bacterium]
MRKGIVISLAAHALATLIVFVSVSFRQVTYLPRETYRVRLVTAAVAEPARQTKPVVSEAPAPKETPKETPKEEPKDDELAAPIEKPKPKPKPKDEKSNEVPRAEITKSDAGAAEGDTLAGETGEAAQGISFDGGDFPYDAFIARMRHKIAAAWQVPAGSEGIERFAVVYFRVHRDGNITHVSVERGSGVFLFDQSCQRAVIQAAPFPPLPREYADEYVGVHFSFKFVPAQP